ncbi:MAG: hypothetical protein ACLTKG_04675 [Collinsella intestinalis]
MLRRRIDLPSSPASSKASCSAFSATWCRSSSHGALSSADSTGAFGLVLMVAFGAIPFVYRRHRKKDPISYKHTGSAAIVAFCGVFAVISIAGGAFSCSEMSTTSTGMAAGALRLLRGRDQQAARPRRRCRPPRSRFALQGRGVGGEPSRGRAPQRERADWPEVALVLDEPMAEVRWYPKTRTLVGARRGRSCHRATRSSRGSHGATKRAAPMAEPSRPDDVRKRLSGGAGSRRASTRRRPIRSSARLYSPGGCGCALLMAPVAAAAMGLGRFRSAWPRWPSADWRSPSSSRCGRSAARGEGASVRPGFAVAAGALYLASVPYLVFFIRLWFVD